MKKMETCNFELAWMGKCKEPVTTNSMFCKKHKNEKCVSCGKPATHTCSETGQFVCGFSLCDNCEHTIFSDGTNGGIGFNIEKPPEGMKEHCKKTEQKYAPWYMRTKTK